MDLVVFFLLFFETFGNNWKGLGHYHINEWRDYYFNNYFWAKGHVGKYYQ